MDHSVDVSIICLTYNHQKYIRQCLDGFIMQKDVTFEIIIHDDASTDGTADIIREYEAKFPNLFKPIYQTENQYSKHIDICKTFMLNLCLGKYIAFCEGDDYWTDPFKLKKQFDVLENNQDCYLCLHNTAIINEDGSDTGNYYPVNSVTTGKMTSDSFFHNLASTQLFHTSCFFFLKEKYVEIRNNPPEFRKVAPVGDFSDLLLFSTMGKIYYIDEVMSKYRSSSIGSWTERMWNYNTDPSKSWKNREAFIFKMRVMLNEFFVFSNGEYKIDLSFMIDKLDNSEQILNNDKFWYCINNKDFKLLFKEFSYKQLKSFGLTNKAIVKMKLQSIFKFIK